MPMLQDEILARLQDEVPLESRVRRRGVDTVMDTAAFVPGEGETSHESGNRIGLVTRSANPSDRG